MRAKEFGENKRLNIECGVRQYISPSFLTTIFLFEQSKTNSALTLSSLRGLYETMDEEVVQEKEDIDLNSLSDAIASSSVKQRRSVLSTLRQQLADSSKHEDTFAIFKGNG